MAEVQATVPARAPTVTILLAAYGRLAYLKEAVGSALAQDYSSFEVLVVDDGSDEETKRWLRDQAGRHSNFHVQFQTHLGVGAARARGVRESKGELVCILDSDDLLAKNALTASVSAMEAEPRADLVYVNNLHLFPGGSTHERRYPAFGTNRTMLVAVFLSPRVPFKHTGTIFRRDVALELGSYDERLACKIDIEFFLKFLTNGKKVRLVQKPLATFRLHPHSISRDRWFGIKAWWVLIDRYCPGNALARWFVKGLRLVFEAAKGFYERARMGRRGAGSGD